MITTLERAQTLAWRQASPRAQDAVERALAALGAHPQTLCIQLDFPSVAQSRFVARNSSSSMGLRRSRSGCAFGYLGASGAPAMSQVAPHSGLARGCLLGGAPAAHLSCPPIELRASASRLHVRSYLGSDGGQGALVPQPFPAALFLLARRPSGQWQSYVSPRFHYPPTARYPDALSPRPLDPSDLSLARLDMG